MVCSLLCEDRMSLSFFQLWMLLCFNPPRAPSYLCKAQLESIVAPTAAAFAWLPSTISITTTPAITIIENTNLVIFNSNVFLASTSSPSSHNIPVELFTITRFLPLNRMLSKISLNFNHCKRWVEWWMKIPSHLTNKSCSEISTTTNQITEIQGTFFQSFTRLTHL